MNSIISNGMLKLESQKNNLRSNDLIILKSLYVFIAMNIQRLEQVECRLNTVVDLYQQGVYYREIWPHSHSCHKWQVTATLMPLQGPELVKPGIKLGCFSLHTLMRSSMQNLSPIRTIIFWDLVQL